MVAKNPRETDWMKLVRDFITSVELHHIEVRGKDDSDRLCIWCDDEGNETPVPLGTHTKVYLQFTLPFDIREAPWRKNSSTQA